MVITLQWWEWILPAVIACGIIGLRQGWRIMGLWIIGVFFAGVVATRLGPKLDLFINKLFSVFGQFFAIATDKPENSITTPTIQIASPWEPLATGALFASLVMLSWWVARRLSGAGALTLLGRLLGGVFGGMAALLSLSQAFDYWADFVKRSGNPSTTSSVTVPQVTIGVASLPDTNPLVGVATVTIALFLILVIVYTVWRALRAAL